MEKYGICQLSYIPLRKEASHKAEITSVVLFGEHFQIIGQQDDWCNVKLAFDKYMFEYVHQNHNL